ncbi:uncharacterized protein LOC119066532 [Bradysia coprophila]|uniref:uncharacterized protein LOC119066532 n=1 Tax=Bradysia coprophila TaxID=38358 RepID=UPI00187DD153|nr:uncharacterized protein LOC119066532 [Bradysia coprophila]
MSSEDDDMDYDTTLIKADSLNAEAVAPKANPKYSKVYEDFQKWNETNGATPVTEDVLMKYFTELAVKSKPTTLWVYQSMLKSTLRINDNIDISNYSTLINFLRGKNAGYKPVKATVFTEEEMNKFINEAPDEQWLDVKVVCIFGINGVHSSSKLINVMIDHIKVYEDLILVTIPKSETSAKRTFTVTGTFFTVMHKYIRLRPENSMINRFFLRYRDEKCTPLPMGRNRFFEMPRRIAKYLKLPKPELYSANSFRMNASHIASANSTIAWESLNNVPEQPQTQYSLDYETGHLRTSLSATYAGPSVSVPSCMNGGRHDHRNGKRNDNKTERTGSDEHICTINCGQVKCATEENEMGALHAFSIMKPDDYKIIEVIPALFASDPICRWIVAYTHTVDPVSSYNGDETFADITRSTPNNVTVIQKYIRHRSSQLLPAYVVVYGVNCRCQSKQSELYNYEVNEIKYEV